MLIKISTFFFDDSGSHRNHHHTCFHRSSPPTHQRQCCGWCLASCAGPWAFLHLHLLSLSAFSLVGLGAGPSWDVPAPLSAMQGKCFFWQASNQSQNTFFILGSWPAYHYCVLKHFCFFLGPNSSKMCGMGRIRLTDVTISHKEVTQFFFPTYAVCLPPIDNAHPCNLGLVLSTF